MPHIHEKIDYAVDVYIVNGDAVLLRKHDKYKLWLVPGGHVELDETPQDAAIREVKEEVGLDVVLAGNVPNIKENDMYEELLPPRFMNIHAINENHKHIGMVYFATSTSRDFVENDQEKSDELRWFTAKDLEDPLFELRETIRFYAQAALKELAGTTGE